MYSEREYTKYTEKHISTRNKKLNLIIYNFINVKPDYFL